MIWKTNISLNRVLCVLLDCCPLTRAERTVQEHCPREIFVWCKNEQQLWNKTKKNVFNISLTSLFFSKWCFFTLKLNPHPAQIAGTFSFNVKSTYIHNQRSCSAFWVPCVMFSSSVKHQSFSSASDVSRVQISEVCQSAASRPQIRNPALVVMWWWWCDQQVASKTDCWHCTSPEFCDIFVIYTKQPWCSGRAVNFWL